MIVTLLDAVLLTTYFLLLFLSLFWLLVLLSPEKNDIKKKLTRHPLFSVIVPAYNEEESIHKTLVSLCNVAYPQEKMEIIVVNDGSTDNTKNIVEEFIREHPTRNIMLINQENKGKGKAMNKGLEKAAGEFFACLDADSFVAPNALQVMLPLFEDDIWEHYKLQKQFRTPICLDESILSVNHAKSAIEMGACRIINIKAGRGGGLNEAIAIHNISMEMKIPNWCGGMLETGVGRASNLALASLPNFKFPADISATKRYYKRDITQEDFVLNTDSTIDVPDGEGLGVSIDEKALKDFSLSETIYEWK